MENKKDTKSNVVLEQLGRMEDNIEEKLEELETRLTEKINNSTRKYIDETILASENMKRIMFNVIADQNNAIRQTKL